MRQRSGRQKKFLPQAAREECPVNMGCPSVRRLGLAIAPKTAEKYITAWCKGGQLVRVAQGKYEKA